MSPQNGLQGPTVQKVRDKMPLQVQEEHKAPVRQQRLWEWQVAMFYLF